MALDPHIIPDGLDHRLTHPVPNYYQGDISSILIPHSQIFDRVVEMATAIDQEHPGLDLLLLAIMDGADMFCTDLMQWLEDPYAANNSVTRQNIRVKSYQDTESSGNVKIYDDLSFVQGKHVIIVEDIVDTGRTMKTLTDRLKELGAADVKVASFLQKRTVKSNGFVPDYVGFSVPDEFVIGYGMDYNEFFRDIIHVGVIHPDAIEKYATKSE